jgi:hypothetical protein
VYYVRVRAVNEDGAGDSSNEAVVVVPGGIGTCAAPPNPPANVQSSVVGNLVTLVWAASAGGCAATSYIVQAGTAQGLSNVAVANVGGATTLQAAAPPATYYVRVIAINAFGASAPSNELSVTVGNVPSGSLTGRWVGTLTQPRGPIEDVLNYGMDLVQTGNQASGTARIEVIGQPRYFANFVVTGTIDAANVFRFQELRITSEQQVPNTRWCLKTGELQLIDGAPPRLSGGWTAPGCLPGTINLSRQ